MSSPAQAPRRFRASGIGASLALLFSVLIVTGGSVSATVEVPRPFVAYRAQAESFIVGGTAQVRADSTASAGAAVDLYRAGAIWRWAITPAAQQLTLRVRASACSTPPVVRVMWDREVAVERTVTSQVWTTLRVDVGVAAGVHAIAIHLVDVAHPSGCDSTLTVDELMLRSAVPVNTGTATSECGPTDGGARARPTPPDRLADFFPNAPAYHEVAFPSGSYAGQKPKGVMLYMHGGGWSTVGPAAVARVRTRVDEWRSRGWSTVSFTSRGCAHWLEDAMWFHDATRAMAPNLRLCVGGQSAGAHVALLLAAERPDIACVVAEGAPTNIPVLDGATAFDPATGGEQPAGPTYVHNMAHAAFGAAADTTMNPVHRAADIAADVLLVTARHDPLIPLAQGRAMRDALDAAQPDAWHATMDLGAGDADFIHATVSTADLRWVPIVTDYLLRR